MVESGARFLASTLFAAAVLFGATSFANVRERPGPAPVGPATSLGRDGASLDLAAAVRSNAPLPVLLREDDPMVDDMPEAASQPAVRVIEGPVEDVFYGAATRDPGREALVAQALKLLAHRLDLTRDIALGDRVRLVVRDDGAASILDYAGFEGASAKVRLYRDDSSRPRYVDETGTPLDRLLLRTPLAVTRITSDFGPRLHPLLGYTRLHRGVDFAARIGTPVLAAGDGVVEAAGPAGGYGQRIVLRHARGLETVYAHLSGFVGLARGQAVRQGQVIGWSGATGAVTGPHLHFEVRQGGAAVDPSIARPVEVADPGALEAFRGRRREIDRLLADCDAGTVAGCGRSRVG